MGSIKNNSTMEGTIFRSRLPDIDIPGHLPLHSYCFGNVSADMSRPCLVDATTGDVLTFADVDRLSQLVAGGLRHRTGVRRGGVVMLLLPNCPGFVVVFLGVSICGAVATTANPLYTADEIEKQVAASGATVIITESSFVEKVLPLARDRNIKLVCTDSAAVEGCLRLDELISPSAELDLPEVGFSPDDVLALPYSSGTTGLPKGVMLTHRNVVSSIAQQVDGYNPNNYIHRDDVVLCMLPLFHIYALSSVLLCGMRVGATVVIMRKYEMRVMLEAMERYKVTVAPWVPPVVVALVKSEFVGEYNLSSVRHMMSAAAPLGKELEEAVKDKLPKATIGQGYGMTEAGPVIAISLVFAKEPSAAKSGSCGTVVRNTELKIIDPETGLSLLRNQQGEICLRGPQIMKGYLNDPKATEETIDREGWLHTGDIGYVDDDDEIFIVDRLKELIKYKAFQVAPAELEALLVAHPDVVGAAVVPMKDDVAGEVPVAFVVRLEGSEISENEIKQYVARQVIFYKRMKRVFFIDAIPKSPSGKIIRKDLRERLATQSAVTVNP